MWASLHIYIIQSSDKNAKANALGLPQYRFQGRFDKSSITCAHWLIVLEFDRPISVHYGPRMTAHIHELLW